MAKWARPALSRGQHRTVLESAPSVLAPALLPADSTHFWHLTCHLSLSTSDPTLLGGLASLSFCQHLIFSSPYEGEGGHTEQGTGPQQHHLLGYWLAGGLIGLMH